MRHSSLAVPAATGQGQAANPSRRPWHLAFATATAAAALALAAPAQALVVDPYFSGHHLLASDGESVAFGFNFLYVQAPTKFNTLEGAGISASGFIAPYRGTDRIGFWNGFDGPVWAPLWNHVDFAAGGEITYGNPLPDVFAVSWVNVHNRDDPTIVNTFQLVLVGGAGLNTNTGIAIQPNSVIFAYGNGTNGQVNLSSTSPAAIGVYNYYAKPVDYTSTLFGLGIGDPQGMVGPADLPALLASGDPFLFNGNLGAEPLAFAFVPGLPEPSALVMGMMGLAAIGWRLGRARTGASSTAT
jgi:hypothetical protein